MLSCLLIAGALCSCRDSYPRELTQADSLLLRGEYDLVDSLLTTYDANASVRKSTQMYRQLLQMEHLFVNEELTGRHFSIVDSLCRYYDHWDTQEQHAKALCFLGDIYIVNGDNPSALNAFLKGIKIAENCKNGYLLCWLLQEVGDIYLGQRMLNECTDYYRKYYDIAVSHRDTLRMALAANRMGKVFTISNNVDSTIYYYQRAIDLAMHTALSENIIPYCKYSLSDIYIQIEDFD